MYSYFTCHYTGIPEDKDTLSVTSLFQFFLPRYKEWYQVGLELGLTTPVLENIARRYRTQPDVALMETSKYWFNSTQNPTWDTLTKGLQCHNAWIDKGKSSHYSGFSTFSNYNTTSKKNVDNVMLLRKGRRNCHKTHEQWIWHLCRHP